jgi:hypothetical protein
MNEIRGVEGRIVWLNVIKTPEQLVENFCLEYAISIGNVLRRGIINPVLNIYQKGTDMVYLNSFIRVPKGAKLYLKPKNIKDELYSGDVFVAYNVSI